MSFNQGEKSPSLNGRSSRNTPYNEDFLRKALSTFDNNRSRSVSTGRERKNSRCNSRVSCSSREITEKSVVVSPSLEIPVEEIIPTKRGKDKILFKFFVNQ